MLETFRRISYWLIGRHHTLIFHLKAKSVPLVLMALQHQQVRTGQVSVVNRDAESGLCEMMVDVTLSRKREPHQLYDALLEIKGVQSVEMH